MKVGVPTEIKTDEYRVALTPAGVRELVDAGHEVYVQSGAGLGSAISDEMYEAQGASIPSDAAAVFGEAELIVKVKEPQPAEVEMLEPRHTLFTYLHLAADVELTRGLMRTGSTCIAYETIEDARRRLPLLAPMSEVAGKIATQAGAFVLEKPLGGRGILLGGVPGVAAEVANPAPAAGVVVCGPPPVAGVEATSPPIWPRPSPKPTPCSSRSARHRGAAMVTPTSAMFMPRPARSPRRWWGLPSSSPSRPCRSAPATKSSA